MAKTTKATQSNADDDSEKQVFVRLTDRLAEALAAFIDAQPVKPSAPAVLRQSLERFLKEQGYLKPKGD